MTRAERAEALWEGYKMAKARNNNPYSVVVNHGDEMETFFRVGRWDADMKADEERRKRPAAKVSVVLINARAALSSAQPNPTEAE